MPSPSPLSRRAFCALSSGLLVPWRALAAPSSSDRCFLFIFCDGGWDQAHVWAPIFGSEAVDMEAEAVAAEVGGIPFVDAENRPSVRTFFERWADRCCLVNGFEVQAVSHERCRRLSFTGAGAGAADDWATIVAGTTGADLAMPHVVVSGPAYSHQFSSRVVRIGESGQLPELLAGTSFERSDQPIVAPDSWASAQVEARLRERLVGLEQGAAPGQEQDLLAGYQVALDDLAIASEYAELLAAGGVAGIKPESGGEKPEELEQGLLSQLEVALSAISLGLTRSVTVRYQGIWSTGWDNHADIEYQVLHFEELFSSLDQLMDQLSSRTDLSGSPLSDKVTVVVFSEMGRDPKLNEWGGRHHWTTTSAMLIGAGVQGGQAVGGWDDSSRGLPVDLDSGALSEGGVSLQAANVGATVLALADVDPGEWTDAAPILGAVD